MRLALALSAALAGVLALEILPGLRGMVQPLQQFTAMLAFIAIKLSGLPIAIDGIMLSHPDGFRIVISHGCTPLVPAIFLGFILTVGLSLAWRVRLLALSSGIVLLTLLNLFRVIGLYYIGVISPAAFDVAHEILGQGVIVFGTAAVAIFWISASVRTQQCIAMH